MKLAPPSYMSLGFDTVFGGRVAKQSSPITRSEWKQVGVRQHAPTPGSASSVTVGDDALPTIETLRADIVANLSAIKRDWDAAAQTVSPEAVRGKLSGEYDAIARLSEVVSTHATSDILGVDALIDQFEKAIVKIGKASDLSFTSLKRVDAQQSISDTAQLTPKAKAAFDALRHLKAALDTMVCTTSVRRVLADQQRALENAEMTPAALRQAKAELYAAFVVTGDLLSKTEPLINHYLTQAQAAIPGEKRRWKTRILILVSFLVITVSLGVASAVLPGLLPALVGLAVGLKLASTAAGVLTACNGIFNVFGYARNRGWGKLSNEITAIKNLNDAVNRGLEARHSVHQSGATTEIQARLDELGHDIARATRNQRVLNENLENLDHTFGNTRL